MKDEELKLAYWSAAYHDKWYSGNIPAERASKSNDATELRAEMQARGLDVKSIDQQVRDGLMPPSGS